MTAKIPDVSGRDIETRLLNWGACQRGRSRGAMATKETRNVSPYGGQGYVCMTAVACNLMRMAAKGAPAGATIQSSRLDFIDSTTITEAWQRLGVRHKTILRDFYALGRPRHILCRELDIKHWPASHWTKELLAAQNAISHLLTVGK